MLKFLCLILFVVGASATQIDDEEKIIGGQNAAKGQFPYQAWLRQNFQNRSFSFCGATILSNRFVLTSAQCTEGRFSSPSNVEVVVGAIRIGTDGIRYAIERIVIHPLYDNQSLFAALAVLRTEETIVFTDSVRAITLSTTEPSFDWHLETIVSGWGRFRPGPDNDPTNFPVHLQWKNTITIGRTECRRNWVKSGIGHNFINAATVCTNNPESVGACTRDIGSPLTTREPRIVLIGIFTHAARNCSQGIPDIYTGIYRNLGFIRAAMRH